MATNKSKLRSEIQALRNQAKARGHKEIQEEELLEKAFSQSESNLSAYKYVYRDLLHTFIFLIIAALVIFLASIKISTFPIFAHLREVFKVSKFSF